MDGQVFLVIVLGLTCYSHGWISGSELEVTVRPGDNHTLYCDCKASSGVYIVWYRNCSHENQPTMVLPFKPDWKKETNLSRFHFKRNQSSESYDLLILNITKSDEGLYYCGNEEKKIEKKETGFSSTFVYRYGNTTTKIILDSSEPAQQQMCWVLLGSLCPVLALLSSLLCSLVVCLHYCKKAKDSQVGHQHPDMRGQTHLNQAEDMCYAALEIHRPSQRPKKKKDQRSDYSTYSVVVFSET